METEVKIVWTGIFDQVQRLSSFEGRDSVTPSGESAYPEIHITKQDESMVKDYARQGMADLAAYLGGKVADEEETDEGITITLGDLDGKRVAVKTMQTISTEAVGAWVMKQWMSLKGKTERVAFYQQLYGEMRDACQKTIHKKKKPSLDEYEY